MLTREELKLEYLHRVWEMMLQLDEYARYVASTDDDIITTLPDYLLNNLKKETH